MTAVIRPALARRMASFAMTGAFDALSPEVLDAALGQRERPYWAEGLGVAAAWGDEAGTRTVSHYEMAMALGGAAWDVKRGFIHSWMGGAADPGDARRLLDAADLLAAAGFEADGADGADDAWLLALAQEAADAGEAS